MVDSSSAGWTIDTLKAYFELKFAELEKLRAKEAEALVLQATEYERRLSALNHEAARINTAAAASVPREVWETYLRGDTAWKSASERDRAGHMPREEYQAQHTALADRISSVNERITRLETGSEGKRQGLGLVGALVLGGSTILAAIATVVSVIFLLSGRH